MFCGHSWGWNPRDKKNNGIVQKNMARQLKHNAVFFTGRIPHTTKEYAKAVWQLLVENGADKIIFVDEISTLDMMMRNTNRMTFFIHGAPSQKSHLSLLEEFRRKVIVHLNFEPRSNRQIEDEILPVLNEAQGVDVIHVADGRETHTRRMNRILQGLERVRHTPISPSIIQEVLRANQTPTHFVRALATA